MKAVNGKFHHALVVADIDKGKIKHAVRKTCADRRKISLLKELKIRKQFEEKYIKFVDVGAPNLWRHLKDGVIKACDKVYGMEKGEDQ